MTLKGNKGEWSELYAFFKLLGDGRLYSGDAHLNKNKKKYYPILKAYRDDIPRRNSYKIEADLEAIHIIGPSIDLMVSQKRFTEISEKLLEQIKTIKSGTDLSYLEEFMNLIGCHTVKAKSTDKADIRLVIHHYETGCKPELGYSVKSKIGSPSTLINSNKDGTNFIYKIDKVSGEVIETFNSIKNFREKFKYLETNGGKVRFHKVANNILHSNLQLLDLGIETILAQALLQYYMGKGRRIDEIAKLISKRDPLEISNDWGQPMYEYKFKQFLLAFALGLTASTPWFGKFNANGGYIVVKEDGDIICYHFFDRNELEDYLFHNTRFETPSTIRHQFGRIYNEKGEFFLKLNLQVRFF